MNNKEALKIVKHLRKLEGDLMRGLEGDLKVEFEEHFGALNREINKYVNEITAPENQELRAALARKPGV
jgi:hypothetical protein